MVLVARNPLVQAMVFADVGSTQTCSIKTDRCFIQMMLPWKNVTVSTDQSAITRGIQISMGTPPQIVSLRPSTSDDALYVVNKAQCAPEYNSTCIGSYGGVFDYSTSSTFSQVSEGQWNGTISTSSEDLSFVHFNDVLGFGNATVYGFPTIYDEPGYGGQGVLPLGSESDFLKIAVETGMIPSTVFGLWTGSRSTSNPVDGSLVLGGYDKTRYKGEFTTFDSEPKCEFCVIITDLMYETEDKSVSLFSNASQTLQVALQPSTRVMYVPQNVWENFRDASGGIYDAGYLNYYAGNPPKGNISVTLQNGYKTTIPTEELFYYPRGYDDEGKYDVKNNTYQIGLFMNATNDGYVMDWGVPFLTMNYIIADYTRKQFKMAEAIRTDFTNQGGGYVLTASCDPTTAATATATGTNVPAATSSVAPVTEAKADHTKAIIGGVVGGILGLVALVGGLGFLFWRHRKRQQHQAVPGNGDNNFNPAYGAANPHTPAMSHANTVTGRYSHWTAMSPTEHGTSELGDTQKVGPNVSVNQWLSSQDSDVSTTRTPNMRRRD